MVDLNSLKNETLTMLKNETKGLWKKENNEFLESIASKMASEQFKALTDGNQEKKQEHIKNLSFLKAQIQGELAQQSMNLNETGNKIISKLISIALEAVITVVKAKNC